MYRALMIPSLLVVAAVTPLSGLGQTTDCTLGRGDHQFEVREHTAIVQALMDNMLPVLIHLDVMRFIFEERDPEAREILEALSRVELVDDQTRSRIRAVLACLPELEVALSPFQENAIADVRARLQPAGSVDDVVEELASVLVEPEYWEERGFVGGVTAAMLIIHDGANLIYARNNPYYDALGEDPGDRNEEEEGSRWDDVADVAIEDVTGAVAGGMIGCGVGLGAGGVGCGPGALSGAVIGAVGLSSEEVTRKLLRRLFRR